jgi:hypothetical protein
MASLGVASASMICCSSNSTGSPSNNGTTYDLGPSACTLQSSLHLSTNASETWTGCQLHYEASNQVYTWQLLPPGTSGSLSSPGPGWITLSLNGNSPENATISLGSVISPQPASVPIDQVIFVYGLSGGQRAGGTGSLSVGSNNVNTNGGGGALSAQFNVQLTGGGVLTGSMSAVAAAAQASASSGGTSDGSSGSGGGSCNQNACTDYMNMCSGNPTSQAPCYCAAACDCACSSDSTCEQQNKASAAQLGTTCTY